MSEVKHDDGGAWYLKDEDTAIVYMCGVDWQHHTLSDSSGTVVYPSEDVLRNARSCIPQCGIVEVEMKVRRWVQNQNMRTRIPD